MWRKERKAQKKRILEWSYDGQSLNIATQLHLLRRTRDTPFTNTWPKALERIALYLWKALWLFSFIDQVSPKRMPPLGQAFWFPWGMKKYRSSRGQAAAFFFLRWELFWLGRALSTWELFMYLLKKKHSVYLCHVLVAACGILDAVCGLLSSCGMRALERTGSVALLHVYS